MDIFVNDTIIESSRPTWENMVESPIIEQVPSKYKLKLKYGGYFRLAKNSCRKKYCFGFQKCLYIDTYSYNLNQLIEEVMSRYPSKDNLVLSILFVDKYANEQSFIELNSDENFMVMLSMYDNEKEATIYATEENYIQKSGQHEAINEPHSENDSDSCPSEESYHSRHSTDNEAEMLNYEGETYSYNKQSPIMKVKSKFPNVIAFRRALNHYALTKEFEYVIEKSDLTRFTARCSVIECEWKIHASIMEDEVTFEVKKMVEEHTCTQSNKCSNRHATQGWIADVVTDKLKSDGDVSPAKLQKWILEVYNVGVPYMRVFRGKEQA